MAQAGFLSGMTNCFLWIPIIIFILPVTTVLWVYKTVWQFIVTKILKRNNYRGMDGIMDHIMCRGSSHELPNVNAAQVWLVEGNWITAPEFSSHFHNCFLEGNSEKYRNLFAYLTTYGGYTFYAHCDRKQLDLSWHIREYDLKDFGQGTLESWAITWVTTNTYEKGRPPWQIAILQLGGCEQGAMKTAIVAKFSHALIDGYSFIHMVSKLTDNPAPYLVSEKPLSWKEKIKYICKFPRDVLTQYGEQAFSRDSQNPYREDAWSPKPKEWFMSLTTLNLASVKLIRQATDTHFVCLMMAAQCGAARRLLQESVKECELPECIWISSSLPWPVHPQKLTNHWTLGFFKCAIRMSDPLERLRWLERWYRDFKDRKIDLKGTYILNYIGNITPTWLRRFLLKYDFASDNVPFFFASLLQSSKQHYLLGRKVKKLYLPLAIPDISKITMYAVTTSHSGQIDLSISANSVSVKSQEELDRLTQVYFIQELDSIAARCGLKIASCGRNDS